MGFDSLSSFRNFKIRRAAQIVHAGGLIAYPTEAVWGLGCSPYNGMAVQRLLQIKKRPVDKGLIVVASSIEQAKPFLGALSPQLMNKLASSWPGPITWLVPKHSLIPEWVSGQYDSVAVRVSAHPVVKTLCEYAGPIISTSANVSGKAPARHLFEVQMEYNRLVDYIVPGSVGGADKPTMIKDLLTDKVLR